MNCEQLNNVKLIEILASLGHHPVQQNEKEAWYINPFFQETKPSFKIDTNRNVWYLHSQGIGGTALDFLKTYLNLSIHEVLFWAKERNFNFSFQKQKISTPTNYSITEVKPLFSYPLKNYLKERGLSNVVWKYVKEVKFSINQKKYFAIGFQNNSDGWELRNSFYKGSLLKKDITSYLHSKSTTLRIFEGFIDFLSFKQMYPHNNDAYIILNSVAMIDKAKSIIDNYQEVYTYLDNDPAGKKMTNELISYFPQIVDCAKSYVDFKDLNEFLIANQNAIIYQDVPLCPHGNLV